MEREGIDMSSTKGMLKTCDRCGAQIFLKLTGSEQFDGGYSSRDTFEKAPDGWANGYIDGKYRDLCPTCSKQWEDVSAAFLNLALQEATNGV